MEPHPRLHQMMSQLSVDVSILMIYKSFGSIELGGIHQILNIHGLRSCMETKGLLSSVLIVMILFQEIITNRKSRYIETV